MVELLDINTAKSRDLSNISHIFICCKRNCVESLIIANQCNIRKSDLIKHRSLLVHGQKLYIFCDKYVCTGTIEHYINRINKLVSLSRMKFSVIGSKNKCRIDMFKRIMDGYYRENSDAEYNCNSDSS